MRRDWDSAHVHTADSSLSEGGRSNATQISRARHWPSLLKCKNLLFQFLTLTRTVSNPNFKLTSLASVLTESHRQRTGTHPECHEPLQKSTSTNQAAETSGAKFFGDYVRKRKQQSTTAYLRDTRHRCSGHALQWWFLTQNPSDFISAMQLRTQYIS